ncbi:unnamed protein product [Paramecium pentaurelia]|uniref:Uncharacterized protein n=1 Tax=Paramecium pentaurelia TaxID=43138 RepID=A0A8S1SCV3_9CILI|nr:unnamed protein product [Paramecium pentaurelia]
MKIQIIDSAAKIYKAFKKQETSKSVRFKFFTNYMLVENQRLKIFDFSEIVIFHEDHKKFIITRLNEFTHEMEIHIAGCKEIQARLESIDIIDQNLLEIKSNMKESLELQKFKKIVSVNLKDELFIIVMTDQLLIYRLESLVGTSCEKVNPLKEIIFYRILVSIKPYVSAYTEDKIYLFQKNVTYKSIANQLIINYKVIDCNQSEKPQLNQKITLQSPQVAQATETMLSYIQKVKIIGRTQLYLSIQTEFKNQAYKQKVIHEFGEPLIIRKQKQSFKQSDVRYIQCISNKNNLSKLNQA